MAAQQQWLVDMKRALKSTPVLGPLLRRTAALFTASPAFDSSQAYWEARYRRGQNSGAGSYGRLAAYKADYLNQLVVDLGINSIVELGCGDGAQLALAKYPQYVGLDISPASIAMCQQRFADDPSKTFLSILDPKASTCYSDCAMSLDVIYHLVEDGVFDSYMRLLVSLAQRYVVVYSCDFDGPGPAPHVRHRNYSAWLAANAPDWRLVRSQANIYPYDAGRPDDTSWADFHVYARGAPIPGDAEPVPR